MFTVGLGSTAQPANVAVSDLAVPARAFPGDRYTVTGYLQAQGHGREIGHGASSVAAGRRRRRPDPARAPATLLDSRAVTLGGDGEVLPVKFDLVPDAPGRRTLSLRVQAPEGDRNQADKSREADIEIVDRKNQVLAAGRRARCGNTSFCATSFSATATPRSTCCCKSGKPGMSQDAKQNPRRFPHDPARRCSTTTASWPATRTGSLLKPVQLELLEKWVAEQAGGLIVWPGR